MSRIITVCGFALIGVLALVLWLISRLAPETIARFGNLLDHVLVTRSVRITLVMFWFWLGWHFFVSP